HLPEAAPVVESDARIHKGAHDDPWSTIFREQRELPGVIRFAIKDISQDGLRRPIVEAPVKRVELQTETRWQAQFYGWAHDEAGRARAKSRARVVRGSQKIGKR